jgi:serine/threonine protein kinase
VAQALAYLHHQRVVHLDIKSRNVLLTMDGRAKIADVGLSQVLANTYLSQLEGLGTFAYAAPELLSGGSNCSTKADIWRLHPPLLLPPPLSPLPPPPPSQVVLGFGLPNHRWFWATK